MSLPVDVKGSICHSAIIFICLEVFLYSGEQGLECLFFKVCLKTLEYSLLYNYIILYYIIIIINSLVQYKIKSPIFFNIN